MTATDISNQLKIGDKVNGLSGLKDCGSGRCVEIRLDGRAVPYYHGIISFDGYKTRETRFSKTKEEIENWIISKTPKGHRIFSQLDSADEMRKDLKKYSSGVMNISLPDGKGTSIWWSISDKICREAWPEEICSQILYLPNDHFKPVCAQHDPYLPEHLKTNRRCISLCDAQGNRVLIRQTGKELEIWQEKYQQSALIDPVTLKVTATGKEKPDIGNLVIRVVRTHVKKTQNHLVEKITLTANQPVSWTIGNRSALAGISEKASSL